MSIGIATKDQGAGTNVIHGLLIEVKNAKKDVIDLETIKEILSLIVLLENILNILRKYGMYIAVEPIHKKTLLTKYSKWLVLFLVLKLIRLIENYI